MERCLKQNDKFRMHQAAVLQNAGAMVHFLFTDVFFNAFDS